MADEISSSLTSLPMEFLISAPLSASVKAQRELGMEMVNLVNLLAYGQMEAKPGAPVKTLDMTLERPVQKPDGTIDTTTVQVKPPLLSLVPVPALLIDSVDISFSMEIHTVDAQKDTSNTEAMVEASAGGGIGLWHADVKATGKVSTSRENTRSTDKTAKYDVTVHASQQPATEGMSKLMDLLASAVEPIDTK